MVLLNARKNFGNSEIFFSIKIHEILEFFNATVIESVYESILEYFSEF